MIALYLIAAHLVGDFILQSRFMAVQKYDDAVVRAAHVLYYSVPFVPVAVIYSPDAPHAAVFMAALFVAHMLTDSHRFRSTLGDVIAWRLGGPLDSVRGSEWRRSIWEQRVEADDSDVTAMPATLRWPPPNEWESMPLLIDQTLHACQLAILGGLLLT